MIVYTDSASSIQIIETPFHDSTSSFMKSNVDVILEMEIKSQLQQMKTQIKFVHVKAH